MVAALPTGGSSAAASRKVQARVLTSLRARRPCCRLLNAAAWCARRSLAMTSIPQFADARKFDFLARRPMLSENLISARVRWWRARPRTAPPVLSGVGRRLLEIGYAAVRSTHVEMLVLCYVVMNSEDFGPLCCLLTIQTENRQRHDIATAIDYPRMACARGHVTSSNLGKERDSILQLETLQDRGKI